MMYSNEHAKHTMRQRISQGMQRLYRDLRGIAATEFALAAPLIMMMMIGGTEIGRYLIIHQKAEKVADTVADLVGQSDASSMNANQLDQLLAAASEVMAPFSFDEDGVVVITSVSKNGSNQPTVNWQYSGGGDYSGTSQVGSQGGAAALPAGFTLNDKENVIITEVFFSFETMVLNNVVGDQVLYKRAFYRPRLGALTSPPS